MSDEYAIYLTINKLKAEHAEMEKMLTLAVEKGQKLEAENAELQKTLGKLKTEYEGLKRNINLALALAVDYDGCKKSECFKKLVDDMVAALKGEWIVVKNYENKLESK